MTLYESIVADEPKLKRGRVWCHTCGKTFEVDAAKCLARGWPTCCRQTMAVDSPAERAASQNVTQNVPQNARQR